MHYSTKHGPSKRRNALANPVAKAICVKAIHQHLRGIQTLAYLLNDGEESADHLAHMAWIIGLGTEVAFHHQSPNARVLHGALRTVHGMALQGYRWRSGMAAPIDQALAAAERLITGHADTAWTMLAGAEWLAHRITTRTTTADDVAGAEIYAPAPEIPPMALPARGEGARKDVEVKKDQQAPLGPEGCQDSARPAGAVEVMDEGLAMTASLGRPSRGDGRSLLGVPLELTVQNHHN